MRHKDTIIAFVGFHKLFHKVLGTVVGKILRFALDSGNADGAVVQCDLLGGIAQQLYPRLFKPVHQLFVLLDKDFDILVVAKHAVNRRNFGQLFAKRYHLIVTGDLVDHKIAAQNDQIGRQIGDFGGQIAVVLSIFPQMQVAQKYHPHIVLQAFGAGLVKFHRIVRFVVFDVPPDPRCQAEHQHQRQEHIKPSVFLFNRLAVRLARLFLHSHPPGLVFPKTVGV